MFSSLKYIELDYHSISIVITISIIEYKRLLNGTRSDTTLPLKVVLTLTGLNKMTLSFIWTCYDYGRGPYSTKTKKKNINTQTP